MSFQLTHLSSLPEPVTCKCLLPSFKPRVFEKVNEKWEFNSGSHASVISS